MHDIIEVGPDCRERFLDQDTFPELKEFSILTAGLSDLKGTHRIERVFEGRMMFSFALSGGSFYQVGNNRGHWQGGQALFVPPQKHLSLCLDGGGFRQSAWLIVEQHPTWKLLEDLPTCFEWPDGVRFAQSLEALHAESFTPRSSGIRQLIIGQIREYMLRIPCLSQESRDTVLESVLLKVTASVHESWTLDRLAEGAGLSRAHLNRRFLAQYGVPPMTKVMEIRMQRAKVMLQGTTMPIAAIAESVGFSNAFYFSTAFKLAEGLSPRSWREQRLIGTFTGNAKLESVRV